MFLIFNLETTKKRLYSMLIIGLFAIPFILFAGIKILINLSKISFPQGLGFSGIVCFFLGYLLFVSYEYCKTRYYSRLRYHLIYIVLMLNFTLWLIFNNPLNKNIIYLLLTAIVLEVALVRSNFNGLKKVCNGILLEITTKNKQRKINWYKFIIFLLVIVFNLFLMKIIPKEVRVNDSIINTPAHFLGYLLGIFIPFILKPNSNKIKSKQKNSK